MFVINNRIITILRAFINIFISTFIRRVDMEIFTDIRRIYIFIVIIIRNYRTINNRALSILLLF